MTDPQLTCTTCHVNPREPGQRLCKACHAAYMRDHRKGRVSILLEPANREWLRTTSKTRKLSWDQIVNEALTRMRES